MAEVLSRAYRQFAPPRRHTRQHRLHRGRRKLDTSASVKARAAEVPQPIDWRDRIAISPPKNQGTCNACTSFALAGTIEACLLIASPGQPSVPISAGFIHTCIGHADDTDPDTICSVGCDMYMTLAALQTNAYARETVIAYPFPSAACAAAERLAPLAGFTEVDDPPSAKSSLVNAPIAADLYIWSDFFSYTTNHAPAYVPDATTDGPYLHSVCVVGFDVTGWIIKNSMGTAWGDGNGFATIPYGLCGMIGSKAPGNRSPRVGYALSV